MFQKKINQLLALTLSAAMFVGQAQFVNAADVETSSLLDITSEDSSVIVVDDEEVLEDASSEESSDDAASAASMEDAAATQSSEDAADTEASDEASEDVSVEESSEDASSEASSDDAASISSSDDAASNASSEAELPDGITGMPEGYELTATEQEIKEASLENEKLYFDGFAGLEEGVDYAEDEVVYLADSKEHAEEVAKAYSGTLKSFEYGVAVIDLSEAEVSVAEAYALAFDEDVELPVVTPNFFYHIEEPIEIDPEHFGELNVEGVETADSSLEGSSDEASEETSEEIEVGEEADFTFDSVDSWKNARNNLKLFNDPFLTPTNSSYQWHHEMIETYAAWEALGEEGLKNCEKVKVGVIDSGVLTSHTEFNGATGGGPSYGNHGTHVAGLIAAKRNNGAGGAGVAPGAKIISYASALSDSDIMAKLRQAKNDGVWVINMSFGGPVMNANFQSVVDEVYRAGVTLVAAMGNECANDISYPAYCNHVIAVASVNEGGQASFFTTTGSWCDIAAPGSNIWSTNTDGGYVMMSGTSMATPIVAGACALYMAKYGHVSPDAMEKALKSSTKGNAGPGTGKGILNVAKLLNVKGTSIDRTITQLSADKKSVTLGYGTKDSANAVVTVTAKDKKKTTVSSGVTYKWTSSNSDIVAVSGNGAKATLSAKGAGSAKVTVEASNAAMPKPVSLTISVTVKGSKIVGQVSITGSAAQNATNNLKYNKDNSLKSATLYLGTSAANLTIGSKQVKAGNAGAYNTAPIWTSSNEKVVTVSTGSTSSILKAVGKGKATITCTARDGSGKKATISVEVKQPVTSLKIAGQKTISVGGSATYTFTTNSDASGKPVEWSLSTTHKGITVNAKNGQVKVAKDVPAGKTATITAKTIANENGGVSKSASITFTVVANDKSKKATAVKLNKTGTVVLGTIASKDVKTSASLTATVTSTGNKEVFWSSSNTEVADLSALSGNTVTVNAHKAGSATITATAADGSGKKASVKVNVINPVESIKLAPATGQLGYVVATGGTITLKPLVSASQGKANTGVNWSYSVNLYNGSTLIKSLVGKDASSIATVSGGKVSAKSYKNVITMVERYNAGRVVIAVTATAKDGSNVSATQNVSIVPRNSEYIDKKTGEKIKFGFPWPKEENFGFFKRIYYQKAKILRKDSDEMSVYKINNPNGCDLYVTSSDPSAVSAYVEIEGGYTYLVVVGYPDKNGKAGKEAKITVKTMDGSNMSDTYLFRAMD